MCQYIQQETVYLTDLRQPLTLMGQNGGCCGVSRISSKNHDYVKLGTQEGAVCYEDSSSMTVAGGLRLAAFRYRGCGENRIFSERNTADD